MSSPPLRVFLTQEQDQTLWELRCSETASQRTKDRAEALRLSHRGWKVDKIANHLNWSEVAVRRAIHRWQQGGLGGLWDAPRSGRQRRWSEADLEYLERVMQSEPKTYSSPQLARKLETERQVRLSAHQVRRILKKKAIGGNELDTAMLNCKTPKCERANKPISTR